MDATFPVCIPSAEPGRPEVKHTFFFGLLPPPAVARRSHTVAEGLVGDKKALGAVRPERVLHITLLVMAKTMESPAPAALIDAWRARARTVRQRPFMASLNRIERWGRAGAGGSMVALGDDGVVGVEALHQNLAHALCGAPGANFTPHMTLLYGEGPASAAPIRPICWTVREFALVHSFVGLTHYEVVDRFPLAEF